MVRVGVAQHKFDMQSVHLQSVYIFCNFHFHAFFGIYSVNYLLLSCSKPLFLYFFFQFGGQFQKAEFGYILLRAKYARKQTVGKENKRKTTDKPSYDITKPRLYKLNQQVSFSCTRSTSLHRTAIRFNDKLLQYYRHTDLQELDKLIQKVPNDVLETKSC